MSVQELAQHAGELASELIELAHLRAGQMVVVGCSSSEVLGQRIGSASNAEVGEAIFAGLHEALSGHGISMAAQCCEHLNRALVIERAALAPGVDIVNAVPQPKAGGSFATAAYAGLTDPVLVERIIVDAGLDIGETLIGMHLRSVAVPLRLSTRFLGEARVVAARTRPKFIGGIRAVYDPRLT